MRLPITMALLSRIIFMHTDYPSGASVKQPPAVETQADVDSQSSTFSKDMSSEQLAVWLRNNPSLSGAEYEQDISKLRGMPDTVLIVIIITVNNIIAFIDLDARINGHTLLSLNDSRLQELETSVGFKSTIMDIITWCQRVKGKSAKV